MPMSINGLFCPDARELTQAAVVAARYGLAMLDQAPTAGLVLVWAGGRLALHTQGKGAPGPVVVDWTEAKARRRLQTSGRAQPLARAVGFKPGVTPSVLDATAGLGQDAFVLAWLGASVSCFERSPVACALLDDGLRRALVLPELHAAASRMRLSWVDSLQGLHNWGLDGAAGDAGEARPSEARPIEARPDCVYLDPMYPDTGRSALSSKNMQAFQQVIGEDLDADQLLQQALKVAKRRVVVKRPRKAAFMADEKPFTQLIGESTRYDIYMVWELADAPD